MERIGLPIPYHLLTSLALFWCSDNPNLILEESVREWLTANDMAYEIGYLSEDEENEEAACDHYIFFDNLYDATAFKLRWF